MLKMLKAYLIVALMCLTVHATIIHVPGQYPTIQAGINVANPGDTVQVAPGTYYENVQMSEGISLFGSGAQNTIIDGGGLGDVVSAIQVSNLVIDGFTVRNSEQSGSTPDNVGIFLNTQSSSGTKIVRNCIVHNNGKGIDIWNDFGGVSYIEKNVIHDNIYDGFNPYLGTVYLTNNTIVHNGRDGYHDWSGGGYIQIQNNIFAENGRYGIYKHLNTPVYISYNDVWNNVEGAYYQGYSGPAQPFIPNPGTGEISADPLFAGGNPFDYHLTWANFPVPDITMSPCIDSGNPSSPLDPDLTPVDMGAYYFNQSVYNVTVALSPYGTPTIPYSTGGSFDYNVVITNNEAITVDFDVWIKLISPERVILGPVNLTLTGGQSVIRDRTQNVPGRVLPVGTYTYEINVGSYPAPVWDSDSFTFDIVPGDGNGERIYGWQAFGNSSDAERGNATPANFSLLCAYPNPFNPETVISFELRDASLVEMSVYDISGREVARIVDGFKPAGVHEVIFDGSELASGVYFARLTAGSFNQVRKLLLVK